MKSKIKDKLVKVWEVGGTVVIIGGILYYVEPKYIIGFLVMQGLLLGFAMYMSYDRECKENSELRRELDKHRR